MPMYFFDIANGETRIRDDLGSELTDDQAARNEASLTLAELAKDYIPGGAPQKNITMWVRNEQDKAVLQLSLSFAMQALD
ncbi:hypothetical protein [Devosia sp. 1566]|uniref:DUF6894 family protein n=1 Tax=Devosia sp. 1566 TaxID=2499144 RepID=UPI000FDB81C8|nr:hypothetical protein [Devosia sp. 1566]